MLTVKQLLLKQVSEAFKGRPDMPLMASLDGIAQTEASWQPDKSIPSIEQIVRHIAWAKSRYCHLGFGHQMPLRDDAVNDDGDHASLPQDFPCGAAWGWNLEPGIGGAIKLLEQSQKVMMESLESCAEEALEKPIAAPHGNSSSAANFFWVMLMHDINHAGQIRTRRSIFSAIKK